MRENSISCHQMRQLLQGTPANLTLAAQEHLADCDGCMDLLLTGTLEAKPKIAVPDGFAARVAASLPARAVAQSHRRPQYGRRAAVASLGLLVLGTGSIAILEPGWLAANTPIWLLIETLTLAEAGAIAYWLGREKGSF